MQGQSGFLPLANSVVSFWAYPGLVDSEDGVQSSHH